MSKAMDDNAFDTNTTPSRCVLGDLSPNVKVASSTSPLKKHAMAGSPLKRSFTAAMESGDGLKYLKRRRIDDSETLSDLIEENGKIASEYHSGLDLVCYRVRC